LDKEFDAGALLGFSDEAVLYCQGLRIRLRDSM